MAKVFCKKFQKELDAMMFPPLPGEKGEELMQNYNTPASNNTIDDLKLKLRKTEKELQEYKLMEVGRQQQNFIQ